jgi:hypothetical protein
VEQTLRPQTLLKIPKLFQVVQESIDTNLSMDEMAALAGFAANTPRENVQMLMLPGHFNGTGQSGVSYWLPDQGEIREMMAQHFAHGFRQAAGRDQGYLRIAIQNSTGDPAAEQAVQQRLRDQGFGNVGVGSTWPERLETTRIVAQNGDTLLAAEIQQRLGFGEVWVESTGELESDVTIQLGQDWQ